MCYKLRVQTFVFVSTCLPIAGSVNCTHTHQGMFRLQGLHSMNLMWHSAPLLIPSDTARLAVTSYSYPTFSVSVNGKLPVLFTSLFLAAAKIAFCICCVMSVGGESMASTIIVSCDDCFSTASLYAVVLSQVAKKCGTCDFLVIDVCSSMFSNTYVIQ